MTIKPFIFEAYVEKSFNFTGQLFNEEGKSFYLENVKIICIFPKLLNIGGLGHALPNDYLILQKQFENYDSK